MAGENRDVFRDRGTQAFATGAVQPGMFCTTRDEALAGATPGDTVWVADRVPVRILVGHVLPALESAVDTAGTDQAGEAFREFGGSDLACGMSTVAMDELQTWLDKHLNKQCTCFGVTNIRPDGVVPPNVDPASTNTPRT